MVRAPVLLVALAVFAVAAEAQRRPEPSGIAHVQENSGARDVAGVTSAAGQDSPERKKSVGLAVAMSAVLPGTGSWYAGHGRHAATHMLVHLGSLSWLLGAFADCVSLWGGSVDCDDNTFDLMLTAFGVNWAWSMVSAGRDADAANRRSRGS